MNETPTEHPAPSAQAAGSPPERFLTQVELADRWKIKVRTIEGWRRRGVGLAYTKFEGRVRYSLSDVAAYEVTHRREIAAPPIRPGA